MSGSPPVERRLQSSTRRVRTELRPALATARTSSGAAPPQIRASMLRASRSSLLPRRACSRPSRQPSVRFRRLRPATPAPGTSRRTALRPATGPSPEQVPQAACVKPAYVPRKLYLAGVRPPAATEVPLGGDGTILQTVFSKGFTAPTDPWEVALLFRDSLGFFRYGQECGLGFEAMRQCFRSAISKRCSVKKSRGSVAWFVSSFVVFASENRMPFIGQHAVFCISAWLRSIRPRGPSVPKTGRYPLNVYNEILSLELPLNHPAVLAEIKKRPETIGGVSPPLPRRLSRHQ